MIATTRPRWTAPALVCTSVTAVFLALAPTSGWSIERCLMLVTNDWSDAEVQAFVGSIVAPTAGDRERSWREVESIRRRWESTAASTPNSKHPFGSPNEADWVRLDGVDPRNGRARALYYLATRVIETREGMHGPDSTRAKLLVAAARALDSKQDPDLAATVLEALAERFAVDSYRMSGAGDLRVVAGLREAILELRDSLIDDERGWQDLHALVSVYGRLGQYDRALDLLRSEWARCERDEARQLSDNRALEDIRTRRFRIARDRYPIEHASGDYATAYSWYLRAVELEGHARFGCGLALDEWRVRKQRDGEKLRASAEVGQ